MQLANCDLSTCFFCKTCQSEWLDLTRLKKQTLIFKKGEQLFAEGSPVKGMFFLLTGAVKVHKPWGGGKELIIRFATGGDIVGVRGFGDDSYKASATAIEVTSACFIPNDHLQASLITNPALSYKLMQFYALELQKAEQRMSDLAHSDVKSRIAGTLLTLQEVFGIDEFSFLKVALSRQDVASYAGTTYETVFKIFTEWTEAGIIATEGKRMQLKSADRLRSWLLKA